MRWLEGTKGQSLSDYIIVVAVISASIISMNTYLRRAIQAKSVDILLSSNFDEQYGEVQDDTDQTTGQDSIKVANTTVSTSITIADGKIKSSGDSNADMDIEAFP